MVYDPEEMINMSQGDWQARQLFFRLGNEHVNYAESRQAGPTAHTQYGPDRSGDQWLGSTLAKSWLAESNAHTTDIMRYI